MKDICCFIKFGEKEHLEWLQNGEAYFSHSKKIEEIEIKEKIKGQGDEYEGKHKIKASSMKMIDDMGNTQEVKGNINVIVSYPDIDEMPVFCMSVITEDYCSNYHNDINFNINFDDIFINTIKNHFPKADSALVILKPDKFITNMKQNTLSYGKLVHGFIRYYIENDLSMMKFLGGLPENELPEKVKSQFSITERHKILFCKDVYFKEEKEYRFILPDYRITSPKTINIEKLNESFLLPIDKLFEGINIDSGKLV